MRTNFEPLGSLDIHGNFWLAKPVFYSTLPDADFAKLFGGCYYVLVDAEKDLLLAASNDHDALEQGGIDAGLKSDYARVRPGPRFQEKMTHAVGHITAEFG